MWTVCSSKYPLMRTCCEGPSDWLEFTLWVPYVIQKLSLQKQLTRCFHEISVMVRKIRAKNWINGWRRSEEPGKQPQKPRGAAREAGEGEFLKKRFVRHSPEIRGQKRRESVSWSRRKFIGCLPQANTPLRSVTLVPWGKHIGCLPQANTPWGVYLKLVPSS